MLSDTVIGGVTPKVVIFRPQRIFHSRIVRPENSSKRSRYVVIKTGGDRSESGAGRIQSKLTCCVYNRCASLRGDPEGHAHRHGGTPTSRLPTTPRKIARVGIEAASRKTAQPWRSFHRMAASTEEQRKRTTTATTYYGSVTASTANLGHRKAVSHEIAPAPPQRAE
jgi:hypothetical protein